MATEVKNLSLEEVCKSSKGNVADALFAIADGLESIANRIDVGCERIADQIGAVSENMPDLSDLDLEKEAEAIADALRGMGGAISDNVRLFGRVA